MGTLLLDPENLVILDGDGDGDGNSAWGGDPNAVFYGINSLTWGSILANDPESTLYESELEGQASNTNIILEATNNITIEELTTDGILNCGGGLTWLAILFARQS